MWNTAKVYTRDELLNVSDDTVKEIVNKLPFYNNCTKKVVFEFRKFSIGGLSNLRPYSENGLTINYVKVSHVGKRSVKVKVYYAPRKDSYSTRFCDYTFKVLHVLGGCYNDNLYIYTLVKKFRDCDRYFGKAVWGLHFYNYEFVIHRINIETGRIDILRFYNEVPVLSGEVFDDYNRKVEEERKLYNTIREGLSKLFTDRGFSNVYVKLTDLKYYGGITVKARYGSVNYEFSLNVGHAEISEIINSFRRVLSRVDDLIKLSQDAVDGLVECDGSKLRFKLVFGSNDSMLVVTNTATLIFNYQGGLNIYLYNYSNYDVLFRVLSFVEQLTRMSLKFVFSLYKKCGGELLVYFKRDGFGMFGRTNKCGFVACHGVDECLEKVSKLS